MHAVPKDDEAGEGPGRHKQLVTNLAYATAMARVRYWHVSAPLPKARDIEGQAEYWKAFYNTWHGKGQPQEFVRIAKRYLL